MPTKRVEYVGNKKVVKTVSPKRSAAAKKAAKKRKGKPLSPAHKAKISKAMKKSPRVKKAAKTRKSGK